MVVEVALRGEEGQGLVEYGLILAFVFLVVVTGGSLAQIGTGMTTRFAAVAALFTNA